VVVVGAAVVVGASVVDVVVVVFLVVVGASVVSGTASVVCELASLPLEQAAAMAIRPAASVADVNRGRFVVGRVRVIVLSAG
jgi:hypothetical protein